MTTSQELELYRPAEIVPAEVREAPPLGGRLICLVFSFLCFVSAAYMIWAAATGNRP
jgi:hypothetical protein